MSSVAAKEIENLSFLGPFLQLSIFAEDNVSLLTFRVQDKPAHMNLRFLTQIVCVLMQ